MISKILCNCMHSANAHIQSIHRAWTIWWQSLPTAFFNHVKFSGLATVWTWPHLDISAVHFLPISNTHSRGLLYLTCMFTINSTHKPMNFIRLSFFHSEKPNHHPLILFGQFQHLAHHLEEAPCHLHYKWFNKTKVYYQMVMGYHHDNPVLTGR